MNSTSSPKAFMSLHGLAQFTHLVICHRNIDLACSTEIAVDAVEFDEGFDVLQVSLPELQQGGQFAWPASQSVAETVGDARSNETSVAPGAAVADAGAFDEDDVSVGVDVMGQQRGPQASEASAHDHQVGIDVLVTGAKGSGRSGRSSQKTLRSGVA